MVNKIKYSKLKKQKNKNAEKRIMTAAHKVFTSKGMMGARMQDIADEAGINKALLHYYFRDKDKLFETIFREEAQKFFPKIATIFESETLLFEKIETFVSEYIDEMLANPYLPWFVMNEINRNPEQFLKKMLCSTHFPQPVKFIEQIEKEIKKRRIKRVNPVHLVLNLLSMTIFPFIAKPMIIHNLGVNESQFRLIMEQRKKEIPKFLIDSIRK